MKGKKPQPIGIRKLKHLIIHIFEKDAFKDKRIGGLELRLIQKMLSSPSKFGYTKLKEAFNYLNPYFKDIGGPCTYEHAYFEEDRGDYCELFQIWFNRSFYDKSVIVSGGVILKGISLKNNLILNKGLLDSLHSEVTQQYQYSDILVSVPVDKTSSFPDNIFQEYAITFGRAYENCFCTGNVGLGSFLAPNNTQYQNKLLFCLDSLMSKKITPLVGFMGFNWNIGPNWKADDGENSYSCIMKCSKDFVDFSNLGPDCMPLFLKHHK